jgi:hypothetical protein
MIHHPHIVLLKIDAMIWIQCFEEHYLINEPWQISTCPEEEVCIEKCIPQRKKHNSEEDSGLAL